MRFWCAAWLAGSAVVFGCGGESASRHAGPAAAAGAGGGSTTTLPDGSWILQVGDYGNDQAFGVGVDADDDVLVLLVRGLGLSSQPKRSLARFNRAGAQTWDVTISGMVPALLAVHPSGDAVVAGTVEGTDATGFRSDNVLIARYDPEGNGRVLTELGSDSLDAVVALNVTQSGHTFVLWNSGSDGTIFSELDQDGELLSSVGIHDTETVFAASVDRNGNLLTVGGNSDYFALKRDSAGQELWTTPLARLPDAVSGDDEGNVLVVGQFGGPQSLLTKLDPDGNVLFDAQFGDSTEDPWLVAGDAFGHSFTVSSRMPGTGSAWHVLTRRFDVDGSELGSWPIASDGLDEPLAISVDSTGALLVVGMTEGSLATQTRNGGTDAFVARIAP